MEELKYCDCGYESINNICTDCKLPKRKEVWILLSVANEHNQPDAAFEKLWWSMPTYEDLKKYDFTYAEYECLHKPNMNGNGTYWVVRYVE